MAYPPTLDSNFRYKYGDGPYFDTSFRSVDRPLVCEYARCRSQIPRDFRSEVHNVASKLALSALILDREPTVLLSGGMDSQVVALGFLEQDIPFRAVTCRFFNGFNDHEIELVDGFAKTHGIEVEYFDLDIHRWLSGPDVFRVLEASQCVYPQMTPHMLLMSHVWNTKGMPILGNGDVYARKDINPEWRMGDTNVPKHVWNYIEFEYILAWYRWAIHERILGGIAFFQHTPEITLSMLLELSSIGTFKSRTRMSTRFAKYEVYRKFWPSLQIRPKYNGCEQVAHLCANTKHRFAHHLVAPLLNAEWKMPVEDFIQLIAFKNEY